MLLDTALQEAIRDWIILGFSALSLLWTFAAAVCILRARKMVFNRLWASRLLLALTGFLWPGCFVLTTRRFQHLIPPLAALGPDGSCDIFVLLVHAIFEPAFCILLVFHIQFDWNLCSRMLCLPRGHSRTGEYLEAISGVCICFFTLLLLLPSLAYHLGWNLLSSSSPWHTEQQPTVGPCTVWLADLLGTTFYGLIAIILLHIYARRLDAVALNESLRLRVSTLRINATISLLIQILVRYTSAIYPQVVTYDYASNCIFVLYYLAVLYTSISVVWLLAFRPVLYDYPAQRRLILDSDKTGRLNSKHKLPPPPVCVPAPPTLSAVKLRKLPSQFAGEVALGGSGKDVGAAGRARGGEEAGGNEGRGAGKEGGVRGGLRVRVEGEKGLTLLISSVMLRRHEPRVGHDSPP